MRVIIALCAFLVFTVSAHATEINVKYAAGLKCHAQEMYNALASMNQGKGGTINLELFCQAGAVKYISISEMGSTAQFVPPNHVIYNICGNPCR